MNENKYFEEIDEDRIRELAIKLKTITFDINKIKKEFDKEWDECSKYLNPEINDNINKLRTNNNDKYKDGIEDLELYSNKLDSIANILREIEEEIKNSTRKLEDSFQKFEENYKE